MHQIFELLTSNVKPLNPELKLLTSKMIRSNLSLIKIATIGGFATVTMGMAYHWKINDNIRKTEYFREALQTLRSHKPAVHLLGEPIKIGKIDIEDQERNYTRLQEAKYEVPVKGPKEKGTLLFWARKPSGSEKWVVTRIELQLRSDDSKRLVVKREEGEITGDVS